MYNGIKRDLGRTEKKTVPLKTKYREPIIDLKKEMDRLVKHYSELYLRETDFIAATLNSYHSCHSQLDADTTIEELGKAIEALLNGNAAMVSHPR